MSETYLKDGTGKGYQAKVDINNRLEVSSITETISANKTHLGYSYNINTGTIALTSANESALLYLKNTGINPIVITALFYLLGNSDGTGDTLVQVIKNPTTGTLVSGGTTVTPINRHFSSSRALTATTKKGVEGSTITDGTVVIESIFNSVGRKTVSVGAIILTQGNSIAIEMTPPSGNGAMNVQMAIALYEDTGE